MRGLGGLGIGWCVCSVAVAVAATGCARGNADGANDECAPPWCDAGVDAAVADQSDDGAAPFGDGNVVREASDLGCGPLNTVLCCTACGAACDTVHSSGASCNGTTCLYTSCAAGWANCTTTAPDLDGCETETNTPTQCAGCGNVCDTTKSLSPTCDGTTCQYQGCTPGWADCTTTAPNLDGCETPTTTPTNCAGCGNVCDTTQSVSPTCDGTSCQYQGCTAGWADCTRTAPDLDGCETRTTTTANCGGCGNACDTKTGTPTCTSTTGATTCTYACNAGHLDCNQAAPDVDGCECTTPACCGSSCQSLHTNGLGQSFYDCAPLGTLDLAQATEACVAFTGDPTQCAPSSCKNNQASVCSATSPTSCACWGYAGTGSGHVSNSGVAGQCGCPAGSDPAWN